MANNPHGFSYMCVVQRPSLYSGHIADWSIGTVSHRYYLLTDSPPVLSRQLESLRREIGSALTERDRALRRAYELRDQLGAGHDPANKNSWNSNINSYDAIQQDRSGTAHSYALKSSHTGQMARTVSGGSGNDPLPQGY